MTGPLAFCTNAGIAAMCVLSLGAATYSQPSISIRALPELIPSDHPVLVESHGPDSNDINIAMGDPLGISITIENQSEFETDAIAVPLSTLWMPAVVVIVHPDGNKTLSPINDPRQIRVAPTYRSMGPGERISIDVYAYVDYRSEIESYRNGSLEYLFPEPGEYKAFVAYFISSPQKTESEGNYVERVLKRIDGGDNVIVSNSVRINVSDPFPGWDALSDAGIIRAVRFANWESDLFADEARSAPVDALVEQSNQPWLRSWYARVKKSPPRTESEGTR